MPVDETVCELLKSLVAGDGTAFDPLHDRLIELGDPRLANLNIWLSTYVDIKVEKLVYTPIRQMFAREFLEMSGLTTSSILNRNPQTVHYPHVGCYTRSCMQGLPATKENGALFLLTQREIQARLRFYSHVATTMPNGHGFFSDRPLETVPFGLLREIGFGMDNRNAVYDSLGDYVGQVASSGHKHGNGFTLIAVNQVGSKG